MPRRSLALLLIASLCLPLRAGVFFDDASTEVLGQVGGSAFGWSGPVSLFAWGQQTANDYDAIMTIQEDDDNNKYFHFRLSAVGNGEVTGEWKDNAGVASISAQSWTHDTSWHTFHACGDDTGNLDVAGTLDAITAATDDGSTTMTESDWGTIYLGGQYRSGAWNASTFDGTLAMPAVWDGVNLVTDRITDMGSLAKGAWPPYVAPEYLASFGPGPFNGTNMADMVTGDVWTVSEGNGTPDQAGHKPLGPWPQPQQ